MPRAAARASRMLVFRDSTLSPTRRPQPSTPPYRLLGRELC